MRLRPITDTNECLWTWTSEFSNDCDCQVIQDQKYKKLEVFKCVKSASEQK